jgi:hypothetical protein
MVASLCSLAEFTCAVTQRRLHRAPDSAGLKACATEGVP